MNEFYEQKLQQAIKQKAVMPYLTIVAGTTEKPCPIHSKNNGIILPVEHDYWVNNPMRSTKECMCSIRQISKFEYQKIKVPSVTNEPLA